MTKKQKIEFECEALSVGDEFLPRCAQCVKYGWYMSTAGKQDYESWLETQFLVAGGQHLAR